MSVSLVTACKDRNECLLSVLPSWLQHNEITEIIIVDWTSKQELKSLINLDNRIKVIRVHNEEFYIPSQANNLAVSFATNENILRVDTDYFFNPYYNFFKAYQIDENSYVCGEPEIHQDRENNPYFKYLYGLLYITKNNFYKVGGYNENIGYYYSYEDSNMFDRLCMMGLNKIKLKNNYSVIHIPHSDKKRFEYFEGGQNVQNDEYYTVESHIGSNMQSFKNIDRYYTSPIVKWETIAHENRYFEVKKTKNNLYNLPTINCISLEECKDRRESLSKQFKEYGIGYVNYLISKRFAECDDIVTGCLAHTLSDGHKGCSVSHLQMIKNWYENTNEPYGFFCEDDLSLETVQYWNFNWNDFVAGLPNDWECIQLLYLKDNGIIKDNKLKKREWNNWSVTCYILKRDYAKKIIDTYIKDGAYHLELKNSGTQPLIENVLFTDLGEVYSIALFVENPKYDSTFCVNLEHNVELHQQTHINSYNKVINMWNNNKNNKNKIVDYFTFFEPLGKEMFELRINVLKNSVDEFVVCESNKTQSGVPIQYKLKNLITELGFDNLNIRVIELDIPDDKDLIITDEDRINCYENNHVNENSLKARARERLQKDALLKVVNDYPDDTVFIHSDIDEIISPNNIGFISDIVRANPNVLLKIPLVLLEGRADLRVYYRETNQPKEWTGMFMATKSHFTEATPTQLRSNANNPFPINFVTQNNEPLKDLGWHFSWMGGSTTRKIKCENFTHYDDTFSYLVTSKYKNADTAEFHNNIVLQEGEIPPSGDKNLVLKNYPINELPGQIFVLPHIQKYLLPDTVYYDFNKLLTEYSLDIESPEKNFYLGYSYFQQGHTAPALSYFLRCAERTDNKLLAYEALIYGYFCYSEQKIRDETAKSLIMHAVVLMPERPEARFLLSCFYEQKQKWMYAYYHANRGLETWRDDFEPLKIYNKEFPGKIGLLFEKAVTGYWWGKNDECRNILLDLYHNYKLNEKYKIAVKDNLQKVGVDINNIIVQEAPLPSIPVIGTAIVNGTHWLKRLISTIDYPVDNFIVINNNGRNQITAELDAIANTDHKFIKNIKICHLPTNIGCPAAWNLIIKSYIMQPYWIICNHDIALPSGFLKLMLEKASQSEVGMVHNSTGFANLGSYEIFLLKDWVVNKYGLFDENFYPGYVEDIDYTMRGINDPIQREFLTELPILHGEENYKTTGSQTWRTDLSLKSPIDNSRILNEEEYMIKKWGPKWQDCQPFKTPFNLGFENRFDLDFCRRKYLGF
jgi:GT2 family glycosyltransferase/GR25 family glycosyltransferase involved in LPS biosynthesis